MSPTRSYSARVAILLPALCAALAWLPAVTPAELLLDMDVREQFLATTAPSHAEVSWRLAGDEHIDDDSTPRLHLPAALVAGPDGQPTLLVPLANFAGARDIEVSFPGGARTAARLALPEGVPARDVPLARLVPEDPAALAGRPVLTWAPGEAVVTGARGWVLERAEFRGPNGELARPVLVDTVLGAALPHPLQALRHVALRQAEGLPVLDADGRVLCVVYRSRSADPPSSICAPRGPALDPQPAPDPLGGSGGGG